LTNQGDSPRHLLLSSYAEVILTPQAGDQQHPAFNKMFIESEYLPQVKGPHPLFLGTADPGKYRQQDQMATVRAPEPEPPNPELEYYVDYCTFFPGGPRPFDTRALNPYHSSIPWP
jgi:hypothetical protein